MARISLYFCALACFFCVRLSGQKKSLQALSVTSDITINGKLDEDIWNSAPIATDFVMFTPDNGKPADHAKRTEVRVLYDSKALYISAVMYDDEPDKILREIAEGFYRARHRT